MGVEEAVRSKSGESFIDVIVSPNAKKTEIAGYDAWRKRLSVKVAAKAKAGEANRALISFFASLFGVSKGDVNIVTGDNSREKTLRVRLPRDVVLEVIDREL
jgi:hypothetical protein